jgi:carbonic anhydrase
MSSQNINISPKNISGKCDLKCSYNFNYPESNSTAKNNGVMINLTPDNSSIPPVTYNTEKYTVSNIYITCPSVHTFNDTTVAAEIFIQHVPVKGGQNLNVGIPIVSSSESSTASNLITQIIQSVSTNAPSNGESTNLNISGFTLQNIVPEKPFFSYTDTGNTNWIVFPMKDAIPLNSNTLTTLGQIIKPYPLPMTGGELFFNSNGPNSNKTSSGIYISCNPTGSSVETTEVVYDTNMVTPIDFNNIWNNPTFKLIIQILIACSLFIVMFYVLNMMYTFLINGPAKPPTSSSGNS